MGSKKKKQKIGYEYYMGIQMIVGLADGFRKLWFIRAGDRDLGVTNVTDDARVYIDKPDLFGGDEGEGGVRGFVDICTGKPTQQPNRYLQSQLGSNIPAWRNFISVVFNKGLITMLSPYIKQWEFGIEHQRGDWYLEKIAIGTGGSTNAVHIVRYILTGPHCNGCLSIPPSMINDANFRQAADILYNEGFGLSIKKTKSTPARDFIDLVLQHVNGIFYENEVTGLFEIKLLRAADTSDLPQLNNSNSKHVSFQRALPAEMANKITVKYSPWASGKDEAVSAINSASVARQGRTIPETVNLMGLDTQYHAQMMANTLLKQKCTPLAKITRTVKKSVAVNLMYGDLVEVVDLDHNIKKMVCRVVKLDLGDVSSTNAQIDLCEDIFALDTTVMIGTEPPEWVDPLKPPVPTDQDCSFEMPYYMLAKYFGEQLANILPEDGILLGCVGKDSQALLSVRIWEKVGANAFTQRAELSPCPSFEVGADVDRVATQIPYSSYRGYTDNLVGTFANVGGECVQIQAVGADTLTVKRGVMDTVPLPIARGTRLFAVEESAEVASDPIPAGSSTTYRLTPVSPIGQLRLEDVIDMTRTITARHAKPYPPANVTFNRQQWPTFVEGELVIQWVHRNRKLQGDTMIGWYEGNITKDPDVTYAIRIKDARTGEVKVYADGIEGTEWKGKPNIDRITVELMAVYPDGSLSEAVIHTFVYAPPLSVNLTLKPKIIPPTGNNLQLKLKGK